jgi:hypothetical protein
MAVIRLSDRGVRRWELATGRSCERGTGMINRSPRWRSRRTGAAIVSGGGDSVAGPGTLKPPIRCARSANNGKTENDTADLMSVHAAAFMRDGRDRHLRRQRWRDSILGSADRRAAPRSPRSFLGREGQRAVFCARLIDDHRYVTAGAMERCGCGTRNPDVSSVRFVGTIPRRIISGLARFATGAADYNRVGRAGTAR